jgi:hypothetical protein
MSHRTRIAFRLAPAAAGVLARAAAIARAR